MALDNFLEWIGAAIGSSAIGATIGAAIKYIPQKCYGIFRRFRPFKIILSRARMPPQWFFTNGELPEKINMRIPFNEFVNELGPYCGFARLRIDVTNVAKERVAITNIKIEKQALANSYSTRFQFIPQAVGKRPYYLVGIVGKDCSGIYEDFTDAHNVYRKLFDIGYSIEFEPGESKSIFPILICIDGMWEIKLSFTYSIGGKTGEMPINKKPIVLGAYYPDSLEYDADQCVGILNQSKAFEDRGLFARYNYSPTKENYCELLDYYESIIKSVFDPE